MRISEKTKDCALTVKVKLSASEIVDERELDRFSRVYLRCFLKPSLFKKNLLEYTGPAGVSLKARLQKPITGREFLFILEHIVVAVKKLRDNDFHVYNMRMGLDQIYINEQTKELQFLYVPAAGVTDNSNIMELFRNIIAAARPTAEVDGAYVARFRYFFQGMTALDMDKIEAFVQREDPSVVNTIKKNNAGQSGFMTSKRKHYYEHMEQQNSNAPVQPADRVAEEPTGLLEEDPTGLLEEDPTGLLSQESANTLWGGQEDALGFVPSGAAEYGYEPTVNLDEDEKTGLLQAEATGLLQDEEATGLLSQESEETQLLAQDDSGVTVFYPELVRVVTGETVKVNKPVFRLGKEKSYVDYFVTNNNAVSRSHADIITRDGGYFVMDLNSKNRTYINNIPIVPLVETRISDGDTLRLGNEEFQFRFGAALGRIPICQRCKAQAKPGTSFCAYCGARL